MYSALGACDIGPLEALWWSLKAEGGSQLCQNESCRLKSGSNVAQYHPKTVLGIPHEKWLRHREEVEIIQAKWLSA
ncbi:hypothetical protein K7432_012385 [Basidiobolus ranarum]|uniref:Uncharacterized protein n=1 Tax=Basidiobolus ranarum TaxID=34480 RepID=A0ABR2VSD0_9FUNG